MEEPELTQGEPCLSLGGHYKKSVLEKDLTQPRGKLSAFSCNILHALAEVKI